MPNITVQAGYLLPIVLDYTLIASKEINSNLTVFWKANETQIGTMYCPYGNIINFSRTSQIRY